MGIRDSMGFFGSGWETLGKQNRICLRKKTDFSDNKGTVEMAFFGDFLKKGGSPITKGDRDVKDSDAEIIWNQLGYTL